MLFNKLKIKIVYPVSSDQHIYIVFVITKASVHMQNLRWFTDEIVSSRLS